MDMVNQLIDLIAENPPLTILAGAEISPAAVAEGEPSEGPAGGPETIWMQYGPRMRAAWEAGSGPAHLAIRRLSDRGLVAGIISEADDIAFDEAGLTDVVELRGSLRTARCPECGYTEPIGCLIGILPVPRCAACGATLWPGSTLAGETTPADVVEEARRLAAAAGVLLVAGSPLDGPPADGLPRATLEAGGQLAIVGTEPTAWDDRASVCIRGDAGAVLVALADDLT
jgi:NAD-dependent deacetylase